MGLAFEKSRSTALEASSQVQLSCSSGDEAPNRLFVRELGEVDYPEGLRLQNEAFDRVREGGPDELLLLQTPAVLTLGVGFHEENLLFPPEGYAARGIALERTDRGGDVTYHGPGQLVIYPIFDVARHGKDLHRWLRDLESTIIDVLADYGLDAGRQAVNSGVWVGTKKICAIGIKLRRWVSTHGLALNCDVDLAPFSMIVPCGVRGEYGVTSISQETERRVTVAEVTPKIIEGFRRRFGFDATAAA